jgi:hypothetical protein
VGSAPTGRTTSPPVWGVAGRRPVIDQARDQLEVLASATGPAELPQLTGGSVVPVDRLVDGEDVDLTGAVQRY